MTEPVTTDPLIAQLVEALRGMTPTQHTSWCMRHEGGVVDGPDGRRVGVGPLVVGTCRCDANARLIAAAPELLATLEKCIAVLESMNRTYASRLGAEEAAVLDEACVVVAKAKGE